MKNRKISKLMNNGLNLETNVAVTSTAFPQSIQEAFVLKIEK